MSPQEDLLRIPIGHPPNSGSSQDLVRDTYIGKPMSRETSTSKHRLAGPAATCWRQALVNIGWPARPRLAGDKH